MSRPKNLRTRTITGLCVSELMERRTLLSNSNLAFTAQPETADAGELIDSPAGIQVSVEGTGGNTDSIMLSLGANPGGAALGGTVIETAVNGVAVFPNL